MRPLTICRAAHRTVCRTPLLLTLSLFIASDIALAAAVGEQVELNATHPAGVPFHHAPGGTQTFQRVPAGTVGTVTALAREGRWLQLRLPGSVLIY